MPFRKLQDGSVEVEYHLSDDEIKLILNSQFPNEELGIDPESNSQITYMHHEVFLDACKWSGHFDTLDECVEQFARYLIIAHAKHRLSRTN